MELLTAGVAEMGTEVVAVVEMFVVVPAEVADVAKKPEPNDEVTVVAGAAEIPVEAGVVAVTPKPERGVVTDVVGAGEDGFWLVNIPLGGVDEAVVVAAVVDKVVEGVPKLKAFGARDGADVAAAIGGAAVVVTPVNERPPNVDTGAVVGIGAAGRVDATDGIIPGIGAGNENDPAVRGAVLAGGAIVVIGVPKENAPAVVAAAAGAVVETAGVPKPKPPGVVVVKPGTEGVAKEKLLMGALETGAGPGRTPIPKLGAVAVVEVVVGENKFGAVLAGMGPVAVLPKPNAGVVAAKVGAGAGA